MKLFFVKTNYGPDSRISGYTAYESDKEGRKTGHDIATAQTSREAVLAAESAGYSLVDGDRKSHSVMDNAGTGGVFTVRDCFMRS